MSLLKLVDAAAVFVVRSSLRPTDRCGALELDDTSCSHSPCARELFLKYRDAPVALLPQSYSRSPTMVGDLPSAKPANESPRIETDSTAEFPKPARTDTVDTSNDVFFEAPEELEHHAPMERLTLARSGASYMSKLSTNSVPPPGSILTGKQEHCVCTLLAYAAVQY